MDFAQYDFKTLSEQGFWCYLKNKNGQPLYMQDDLSIGTDETDAPCRVMLRGVGTGDVRKLADKLDRLPRLEARELDGAKPNTYDAIMQRFQKATRETMESLILAIVEDWENIVYAGELVERSDDMALRLFGPDNPFLFEQIFEAIRDRRDFLDRPEGG